MLNGDRIESPKRKGRAMPRMGMARFYPVHPSNSVCFTASHDRSNPSSKGSDARGLGRALEMCRRVRSRPSCSIINARLERGIKGALDQEAGNVWCENRSGGRRGFRVTKAHNAIEGGCALHDHGLTRAVPHNASKGTQLATKEVGTLFTLPVVLHREGALTRSTAAAT